MRLLSVVPTPNPDALKFNLEERILSQGSRSFTSIQAANEDLLARNLFTLEGVTSVFYMAEFVTVNKRAEVTWDDLEPKIIGVLREHEPESETKNPEEVYGTWDRRKKKDDIKFEELSPAQRVLHIDNIIDSEIRPGLAGDGGGLEIVSLEDFTLQVHYEGACGSCPSSTSGTLQYIQSLLRSQVDDRLEVMAV